MTALERFVRAVGVVSVGLAAVGVVRPRELACLAGVRTSEDPSLPVLVRLNAARQAVVGLALLTRTPVDVRRSAGLFLPLTALDAAAVLLGVRASVLAPRAAAMALSVLGVNVAVALAAPAQQVALERGHVPGAATAAAARPGAPPGRARGTGSTAPRRPG